jgi:hypothetical protein
VLCFGTTNPLCDKPSLSKISLAYALLVVIVFL